jgi:2-aminoethylphosphonate transport system substrate-binding protein
MRFAIAALLAIIGVLVPGCGGGGPSATLTVYSPSGLGKWYQSRFEKFTAETGIKVTLFEAGSGEVVSRVNSPEVWRQLDSGQSVGPADLLITLPPFIQRAEKAGLLQASGADTAGISPDFVGPGGMYIPIVKTALCFIANPGVTPLPATWDDLLRPDLRDKLQYSTPGEAGDGTAVLLLLQQLMGKQGALDYLAKLESNNVGPSKSTGALQPKVSSGELSVANGDVQMNLASINDDGSNFTIFFPAMPGSKPTTVSLAYVAGVTAGSQHPEEAKKLLAYLLSDESQKSISPEAFGIPVRDSIAQEAARDSSPLAPARLLKDVQLWTPDWNKVLAELESDIASYQKAVGG